MPVTIVFEGRDDGASSTIGKLSSALGGIGQFAAGNLAARAIENIGSAAIGMATQGVKSAADFQTALNVLGATTGATDAQLKAISDTAKALGADVSLPATSATDAANAMLELSKAGLSVDDTLKAAKGTLQLAAAGSLEEAEAAKITANALNTFHLEGDQATRVANLLAAAANASSADVRDLAQGVQQGGFIFQASGQKVEDLVASVSLLTNVGLTGSDSGTALKNALIRLNAPTKAAAATMKSLGFNAFDAQGKMKPMRDLIGQLNAALKGMTPEIRNQTLETLFMSDGMKAFIPLLDAGVDGYDRMVTAVTKQNAAADLAGAKSKGLAGAWDALNSAGETLLLDTFEPFLAPLTDIVKAMTDGMPVVAGLGKSFGSWASGGMQAVISWLSTSGVPMLSSAFSRLAGVAGTLATVFAIGKLFGGGIEGGIANLGRFANTAIAGLLPSAIAGMNQFVVGLLATISAQLPMIRLTMQDWSFALIDWIVGAVPIGLDFLGAFMKTIIDGAMTYVPLWASEMAKFAIALVSWIGASLPGLANNLGLFFNNMTVWVLNSLPTWASNLSMLGGELVQWVIRALPTLATNLGMATGKLLGWLLETAAVLAPKLVEFAGMFINWVAFTVIPALPGALLSILDAIINFFSAAAIEIAPHLMVFGSKIVDTIGGLMNDIQTKAPAWIEAFKKIGKDMLDGLIEGIKARIQAAIAAIINMMRNLEAAARGEAGAKSPATKYIGLGDDISAGLSLPFLANNAPPIAAMQKMMGGMEGAASRPIPAPAFGVAQAGTFGASPVSEAGGGFGGGGGITVNVTIEKVNSEIDIEAMAYHIAGVIQRRGATA